MSISQTTAGSSSSAVSLRRTYGPPRLASAGRHLLSFTAVVPPANAPGTPTVKDGATLALLMLPAVGLIARFGVSVGTPVAKAAGKKVVSFVGPKVTTKRGFFTEIAKSFGHMGAFGALTTAGHDPDERRAQVRPVIAQNAGAVEPAEADSGGAGLGDQPPILSSRGADPA